MFVPVVTKDMQLFSQQGRVQRSIKNVRSRAQSLEANLASMSGVTNCAPGESNVSIDTTNSGVAIAINSTRPHSSTRNCHSVGALPTSSSAARSPPKASIGAGRKPLDPIVEGVAVRAAGVETSRRTHAKTSAENQENYSTTTKHNIKGINNKHSANKSTPDLNDLKITERQMHETTIATTSSSPGLCRTINSPSTSVSNSSKRSNGSSNGKSLVKWLTNTLKGKSNSKDHGSTACAKCARLDDTLTRSEDACNCVEKCNATIENEDSVKTWRSIEPSQANQRSIELDRSDNTLLETRSTASDAPTMRFGVTLPPIVENEVTSVIDSKSTNGHDNKAAFETKFGRMPSDQDLFFKVGHFDRNAIDLTKTPMTVEEYMRHMVVERERCKEIVHMDTSEIRQLSTKRHPQSLIPVEESAKFLCALAPGREWNEEKSRYFETLRDELEMKEFSSIPNLRLPAVGDRRAWCNLCFCQRSANVPVTEGAAPHHRGTPPTPRLVKQLGDNQINHLITYQIEYAIDNGYSRPVFEWIFALLLVIKKPLLQDVCSILRSLARKCREWRAAFDATQHSDEIRECSALIAIISIYFGQRDLSD